MRCLRWFASLSLLSLSFGGASFAGPVTVTLDFDTPTTGSLGQFVSVPTPYGDITFTGQVEASGAVPGGSGNGLRSQLGSGSVSINGGLATSIQFNYGGFAGGFQATVRDAFGKSYPSFYDPDTTIPNTTPASFSGGYFSSMSFFDPVGARADIDNLRITFEDPRAILSRSISDLQHQVESGAAFNSLLHQVSVVFEPKGDAGNVPISRLAQALGYDHFNWVQHIDIDPTGTRDAAGHFLTPPFLDPPPGGYTYRAADSLPFYFNEGINVSLDPRLSIEQNTNPDSLVFYDDPSDPGLTNGQFIGFITDFVGVRSDKTYDVLYAFRWGSDQSGFAFARYGGNPIPGGTGIGGAFLIDSNLEKSEFPQPVLDQIAATGGSFPAAAPEPSSAVPEPSSLVLSSVGLALCGASMLYRSKNRRYCPDRKLDGEERTF